MKKGSNIRDIDIYIPEQLDKRSAEWLEKMDAGGVQTPIKNLYTFLFDDDEAEVLLKGNKIAELQCTCTDFQRDHVCVHVAALLRYIKSVKIDKKVRRQTQQPVKRNKKSQTKDLLNKVPHEDLIDFVRQYATRNRTFNLMLKAKFAYLGAEDKEKEEYEKLIQVLINHVKSKREKWSPRKVSRLKKYLEPLLDQVDTYLATKAYSSAIVIIEILMKQILPISFRVNNLEQFKDIASSIIQRFTAFCHKRSLPPNIKIKLSEIASETILSEWYMPVEVDHFLYFLPTAFLPSKGDIQSKLIQRLHILKHNREASTIHLALLVCFFSKSTLDWKDIPINEGSWSMYQWNLFLPILTQSNAASKKSEIILGVLDHLVDENVSHIAFHHFISHLETPEMQSAYIEKLAEFWLKGKIEPNTDVLFESLHGDFLETLIELATSPKEYEIIVNTLPHLSISPVLLEPYLTEASPIDTVIGLLPAISSDMVLSHLPMIESKVLSFMEDFFGQRNIDKFIHLCQTLDDKGLTTERQELVNKVLTAMPERHLLKSAVSEIYGKVRL